MICINICLRKYWRRVLNLLALHNEVEPIKAAHNLLENSRREARRVHFAKSHRLITILVYPG